MAKQKYYKTKIVIEILSDFYYDPPSIEQVHYDITNGDCSGVWDVKESKQLTKKQMTRALKRQGSDPSFLILED